MVNQFLLTTDVFLRTICLGKIYLGWAEPVELLPGNYSINLAAKLSASLGDTVILKLPLSSTEYYLIENRQRDVSEDGAKLTYKSNGSIVERTFLKDTTGFYSYDTDSLSGVVIDVDELDWALPGNGIVIWHIDDNVINEKLAENKINTDKKDEVLMLKRLMVFRISVKHLLPFLVMKL